MGWPGRRAVSAGGGYLDTVLECSIAASIIAAVKATLGIALLSDRHIGANMEAIGRELPPPPPLAYVKRQSRSTRNPALGSLISEVEAAVSHSGRLSLAA